MKIVKIVAFDLDGTLVDAVGDIAHALNLALAEHGRGTLPVDVVRGFVGKGARNLVARALDATARTPERDVEREAAVDALLATFRTRYDEDVIGRTFAYDGVREVLAFVRERGAKVAVTTNKPGRPARAIVHALLPGLVDVVVGPDDVPVQGGALKPDPAMLHAAARALAGDDGRLVALVGDSGIDVATARNAGVRFVGVAWGLRPEELGGCTVAKDAAELRAHLAALLDAP